MADSTTLVIRGTRVAIEPLTAARRDALNAYYTHHLDPDAFVARFLKAVPGPGEGDSWLVAVVADRLDGERIVGEGGYRVSSESPSLAGVAVSILLPFRGAGLGTALVAEVAHLAMERQIAELEAATTGADAAGWFERRGWSHVGDGRLRWTLSAM